MQKEVHSNNLAPIFYLHGRRVIKWMNPQDNANKSNHFRNADNYRKAHLRFLNNGHNNGDSSSYKFVVA